MFCRPAANGALCNVISRPIRRSQGDFYAWRDSGRWHRIVGVLVRKARRRLGRRPRPTAAIIDSQSASTTQAGGQRGFDPGKRVYGRKRHIVTDTNGLLLAVYVHPANVQDVHGAVPFLRNLRQRFPKLQQVFALSARPGSRASSSYPDVGSSNAPSPGVADAVVSPETSKAPPRPKWLGFSLLIHASDPSSCRSLNSAASTHFESDSQDQVDTLEKHFSPRRKTIFLQKADEKWVKIYRHRPARNCYDRAPTNCGTA
jgi:transposase